MPVQVIVGAQWGDEGKGKIVDHLSENVDIVARYQGGANAGHTVITQGFWGSATAGNGQFNGVTAANLLTCLLNGTGVTVGVPGVRSLTIMDAACIMSRLPATGTPTALPNFASGGSPDRIISGSSCNTTSPAIPLDSKGKFKNVLLGQTVTLALNLRFDSALGAWQLPASFTTVAALAGPDAVVGEPLACTPNGADPNDDQPNLDPLTCTSVTRTIPASLVGMTVNQLLVLANQALAGMAPAGISITDINVAVSAVNEGWDKCRFLGTCPAPLLPTTTSALVDLGGEPTPQ